MKKLFDSALALMLIFVLASQVSGNEISNKDKDPIAVKTYVYKRVDNLEIKADVYRQPGTNTLPAILWIHGGALINGSRLGLPPEQQMKAYLDAGYALVSIDYRLAPETQLAGIIEDVEDAYQWLRIKGPNLFNIDPNNIAVMGMSAGGYLTLTAGFRFSPRPKALVSFYGYGDITGPWYSEPYAFYRKERPLVSKEAAFRSLKGDVITNTLSLSDDEKKGRGEFYLYCRQNGLWPNEVSGHDPATDPSWFQAYEARQNISPAYPPTLLLHGEKDTDVLFEQSILMAKELKRHGVDHELISQAHWGHGFDYKEDDPTVSAAHKKVLLFLAENFE